ncbi:hypothetical protein ACUL41_11520 [Virgibacillus natechei]
MNTHFPVSPHAAPCFPVYMVPYNTMVGHDWMKQEKTYDFAPTQAPYQYNYPKQTQGKYMDPKDYYSLS